MPFNPDKTYLAALNVLGIPVWFWKVGDHHGHKKGSNLVPTLTLRRKLGRLKVVGIYVFGWKDPMKLSLWGRLKR
jgi:hypothetical protein